MNKSAVIFGVTGQDGSYLAELLLSKDYWVTGVARRTSTGNDDRIRHLAENPNFELVSGDVTDAMCVYRLLKDHQPDEIYNLAAQSHVAVSFDEPAHTTQATYLGCLNILEGIRSIGPEEYSPRFYQASSSEMFGSCSSARIRMKDDGTAEPVGLDNGALEAFQDELTSMAPNSPYAIAKLAAHHLCRVYRSSYGIFACSGILFNHESERRGETFVTRKITKYIAKLAYARRHGKPPEKLQLGNLDAQRDWGHAEDYVRGMWLMLQQEKADDYVLATGEAHSVADFLAEAFKVIGVTDPQSYIEIDPSLYRPCEVPMLRGEALKAKEKLGWEPTIRFPALVKRMVLADISGMWGETLAAEMV